MGRARGTPNPREWVVAQTVSTAGDSQYPRTLYEGVAFANTTEKTAQFTVAGASRARARFKASVDGTLALYFVRPDGVTLYAAGNPTTVAVTANTETLISTEEVSGEAWCVIGFTPAAGSGACTLFDFMAL